MTMLESTVSMLKMLPEADLQVINSMAKRLLSHAMEDHSIQPLTEQEWEKKLDRSLQQASDGMLADALQASRALRKNL